MTVLSVIVSSETISSVTVSASAVTVLSETAYFQNVLKMMINKVNTMIMNLQFRGQKSTNNKDVWCPFIQRAKNGISRFITKRRVFFSQRLFKLRILYDLDNNFPNQ